MQKGIDFIGVGAGAVIFNKDNEVFLALRGNDARNERNTWEFPGGSVEFGETLEHALRREIFEEYGFRITVLHLLDVVDHILPTEKQHWVSPTFLCRYRSGLPTIREPRKCTKIGWFPLDRVPRMKLSRASRASFRSLRRYLKDHD